MFSKTLAAVCSLAAVANAHMFLASPVRFTSPEATNGPIDSSNFPCQATSGTTYSGTTTDMALGSDQPLTFEGQSVHGGGSCQVSITYDESPTASSTWKVITSIEGGCVARDTEGNLGSDTSATAADPYTYNFTIPDNIPTGKAVLAWTWFNKVGNREMYMQCASIDLTGSSGDQSNYDALPDMFTANIDNGCTTQSDTDVQFPNPGDVVQKLNGATDAFAPPLPTSGTACGASGSSAATTTAAASGGGGAATTSAPAAGTTAAAGGGGVFATAGGSSPTTTSETVPAATTGSSSSGSSSGSSSSSSSSSAQTGACSDEGSYTCLSGGTTYQVCASGEWSVAMDVASGTECSGSGADFAIAAASSKKSRFRRSKEERRAFRKRGLGTMFNRA